MASDALSSTGTSPRTALRRKYEALSGRTPSAAESEVLAHLCAARLDDESPSSTTDEASPRVVTSTLGSSKVTARKSTPAKVTASKRSKQGVERKHDAPMGVRVQLAGARPEALAHLALALATSERSVLFVSSHEGLLHERHHKFSRRAPSRIVRMSDDGTPSGAALPGITWCSTAALAALVVREGSWRSAIGSFNLIVVEGAEGLAANAPEFSPLLIRLGRALEGELAHVPALLGSAYHAKLPAVRIEEALSTSALVVREAQGLDLSAELERLPRPLLALCSTPAEVDAVFAELSAGQVPVHRYHRGMSRAERARELVRFALPGRRAILVATSGFSHSLLPEEAGSLPLDFGRGYARGDLRSIVHLSVPLSLSEYTAELGLLHSGPRHVHDAAAQDDESASDGASQEGGAHSAADSGETDDEQIGSEHDDDRDDGPERVAVLFVDRAERADAAALLARRRPEPSILLGAHAALAAGPLDLEELAHRLSHSPTSTLAALRVLVEAGLAEKVGSTYRLLGSHDGGLEPWLELASDQSSIDAAHNDLAWSFALDGTCRTAALRDTLGSPPVSTCRCDVCSGRAAPGRRHTDLPTVLGVRPRAHAPAPVPSLPAASVERISLGGAQRAGHSPRGPGVIRAVSRVRG